MNQNNQTQGHILVVACPFQGHAAPLMKLSHYITKFGTHKVTFVTTSRARLGDSSGKFNDDGIRIISIPDGVEPESGWKDQEKLHESVQKVMPEFVKNLLEKSNQSSKSDDDDHSDDRISGVIVDSPLAFMLEIPKKMGIKIAMSWCSTPGCLALGVKVQELIDTGFIDNDGTPLKHEKIQVLPDLPAMAKTDLMWYFPSDTNIQKSIFHVTKNTVDNTIKHADWILCNWFHDLYPAAQTLTPNILSIGPLLANGQSSGSFCSEDSTCLTWLDKQAESSVIYVAFGSTSRFSAEQLNELAFGLESTGRPFLWVAWSGLKNEPSPSNAKNYYMSDDFLERVADRGKMVEWAPQEGVLAHPSVACFVTHCGWGSFMEGVSNGVPLLCWPYFGDQLYTRTCICDTWKVGLGLEGDGSSGIVSRDEIKRRVEELLQSDCGVRENALRLKEMARRSISKGGSSLVNLEYMMGQMKF